MTFQSGFDGENIGKLKPTWSNLITFFRKLLPVHSSEAVHASIPSEALIDYIDVDLGIHDAEQERMKAIAKLELTDKCDFSLVSLVLLEDG
jgi:hypothetical protein